MQTDERDEQDRNANGPMSESLEPVSILSVERDEHPSKQDSPSPATDDEIQIDESDVQFWNPDASINER
jgi:hypothetical protein